MCLCVCIYIYIYIYIYIRTSKYVLQWIIHIVESKSIRSPCKITLLITQLPKNDTKNMNCACNFNQFYVVVDAMYLIHVYIIYPDICLDRWLPTFLIGPRTFLRSVWIYWEIHGGFHHKWRNLLFWHIHHFNSPDLWTKHQFGYLSNGSSHWLLA